MTSERERASEITITDISPEEGVAIMHAVSASHPDATILFGPESRGVRLPGEGPGEDREPTVEDRLVALLADLRRTNDRGQNPQLGEAADHVAEALVLVKVWALGIVL